MTDLRRLTTIRGLRNNNPGNIRISDTPWQGKIPKAMNTDKNKAFEQFESLEYGLRALMKNAYTWIERGKNTLEKLITVWAPPHENQTVNYIDYVARQMQIPKNQEFKTLDKKFFVSLAKAITEMENGLSAAQKLVPYSSYEQAYRLMGSISYTPPTEKKNV
jgi:prophage muMc02, structural protein P5|nr:MAG TPA: virion protein [Caudoviricetes sp.]